MAVSDDEARARRDEMNARFKVDIESLDMHSRAALATCALNLDEGDLAFLRGDYTPELLEFSREFVRFLQTVNPPELDSYESRHARIVYLGDAAESAVLERYPDLHPVVADEFGNYYSFVHR